MALSLTNKDKNIYDSSAADSHDIIIQQEPQIENLKQLTSSSISQPTNIKQTKAAFQEIEVSPHDELIIKPYDEYEVAFRTGPLVLFYIDKEKNEMIKVDVKNKAFIRFAMDKITVLSDPIPINFKNKNEKELYKRTRDTCYRYDHAVVCLII